jgi:PKD repeat protein
MLGAPVRRSGPGIGGRRPRAGARSVALALLVVLLLPSAANGWAAPAPHDGAPPPARPTGGTDGRATAASGALPVAHPRPAAFTVAAVGTTPAAIDLQWTRTNDGLFSNYTVQLSENGSSGPWRNEGVIASQATTSFATGGLTPGANESWQVIEHGLISSQTTSAIAVPQPGLAYLNFTMLGPSSAKFTWTNNATYGGALSFGSYTLEESSGGGAYAPAATVSSVGVRTTTVAGLSPSSSYQFFLNTTDCVGSCAGGPASVTASNVVTLGTPLPLAVTLAAARSVVDLGQSDFFTCTPAGGSAPFSYAWSFGGVNATGSSSRAYVLGSAGTLTVNCTVTDALASRATSATVVTVHPYPTMAVALDRSTADVGQAVGFTCAVSEGTAPYVVAWDFGDGSSQLVAVAAHSYLAAGRFVPTCSATDASGASLVGSLLLNVSPAVRAAIGRPYPGAAPGSSVPLAALPAGGTGTYVEYTWTFGDGQVAAGENVSHAYSAAGNFTVQLAVNDSNGGVAHATTNVSVRPLRATIAATPARLAAGGAVLFTAIASGGAGGYNFTWQFGDGTTGYGAVTNHTYRASGQFQATVLLRDGLGATVRSNASALVVTLPPTPFPLTTLLAVLVAGSLAGLLVGLLSAGRERRRAERTPPSVAGYIPPTDPSTSIRGVKVCRTCGTTNVALRESCTHCGAPLPRTPSR